MTPPAPISADESDELLAGHADQIKARNSQRVRVLEVGHRLLTDQISEVTVGMQGVQSCLTQGATRMQRIEQELAANSTITAEIRDILSAVKLGLKVLGSIGLIVRWAGFIAAACAAIYTSWHMIQHGGKPPGTE